MRVYCAPACIKAQSERALRFLICSMAHCHTVSCHAWFGIRGWPQPAVSVSRLPHALTQQLQCAAVHRATNAVASNTCRVYGRMLSMGRIQSPRMPAFAVHLKSVASTSAPHPASLDCNKAACAGLSTLHSHYRGQTTQGATGSSQASCDAEALHDMYQCMLVMLPAMPSLRLWLGLAYGVWGSSIAGIHFPSAYLIDFSFTSCTSRCVSSVSRAVCSQTTFYGLHCDRCVLCLQVTI